MADILIYSGSDATHDRAAGLLVNRPGVERLKVGRWEFPWGTLVAQTPPGAGLGPGVSGSCITLIVGRPCLRGGNTSWGSAESAAAEWIASQGGLERSAGVISAAMSGMFAVFECDDRGVRVLTDRMGFRPVYLSRDSAGVVTGLGTHVESLACATGNEALIDPVSVAELVVHNYITFPFTTRTAITELEPASLTIVHPGQAGAESRVLWAPVEPSVWPSEKAIAARLRDALLEAGDDLTRGTGNPAVLLSGGIDSRLVLSAIPPERGRTAVTYVTRENNETGVAQEVARAAGVPHEFVRRSEHFFPTLVSRGSALLGCELRANAHGLCLSDADMCGRFGVVIGGQLSDTFLKDHYMPFPKRARWRRKRAAQHISRLLGRATGPTTASSAHTTGREQLESHLSDPMRQLVRSRRRERLEDIRRVRPTTADEWMRFWPASRQDDSAHTMGNTRIAPADTLFAHSAVVEVTRDFSPRLRVGGRVANRVFFEICGHLAGIPNANTGLPANAQDALIRRAARRRRARAASAFPSAPVTGSHPWNDVPNSWVDSAMMQRSSPEWVAMRRELAACGDHEVWDAVFGPGRWSLVTEYQETLPPGMNFMIVQVALWLHGATAGGRSPAKGTTDDLSHAQDEEPAQTTVPTGPGPGAPGERVVRPGGPQ